MSRPQKGRKPRKHWHQTEEQRAWQQAADRWPDLAVQVGHDGTPRPLRQGSPGYRTVPEIRLAAQHRLAAPTSFGPDTHTSGPKRNHPPPQRRRRWLQQPR